MKSFVLIFCAKPIICNTMSFLFIEECCNVIWLSWTKFVNLRFFFPQNKEWCQVKIKNITNSFFFFSFVSFCISPLLILGISRGIKLCLAVSSNSYNTRSSPMTNNILSTSSFIPKTTTAKANPTYKNNDFLTWKQNRSLRAGNLIDFCNQFFWGK